MAGAGPPPGDCLRLDGLLWGLFASMPTIHFQSGSLGLIAAGLLVGIGMIGAMAAGSEPGAGAIMAAVIGGVIAGVPVAIAVVGIFGGIYRTLVPSRPGDVFA